MSNRRIRHIDPKTGEVVAEYISTIQPRTRNGFHEDWCAVSQRAFDILATKKLPGTTCQVLFKLLARLDFENWILVNQSELAEELDMRVQHFHRALKRLEAEGILLRGPKLGRSPSFRINPTIAWKGSGQNHRKALNDRMKAKGLRVVKN